MKDSYSYFVHENFDGKSREIYLVYGTKEKFNQLNKETISAITSVRKANIENIVNRERERVPKRIISSQKDRSDYSSKLPIPLRKILKESTGEIEVSEVQSKRLFNLCAKFTQTNLKLPGVTSSREKNPEYLKFEAKSIQNSRVLSPRYNIGNFDIKNKITKKIKVDETLFDLEESDDSKTNDINNFSRVLNKEVCQMNYKAINELMKSKVLNTKICRRQLFTFNSLKMRLKSPKIKRESLL